MLGRQEIPLPLIHESQSKQGVGHTPLIPNRTAQIQTLLIVPSGFNVMPLVSGDITQKTQSKGDFLLSVEFLARTSGCREKNTWRGWTRPPSTITRFL